METLQQTRGFLKAALTRMETFIDKHSEGSTLGPHEFKTRHSRLSEVFRDYCKVQNEIDLSAERAEDEKTKEEIESRFFRALAFLSSMSEPRISTMSVPSPSVSVDFSNSHQPAPAVKLPNIEVPPFTGNPADWVPFYELFTTLIIENPTLNNIQKFMYLKSYVKNEPANLISSLPLSNDNFSIAIATLEKRYSNKLLRINTHIKSLFDMSGISKCNAKNLREFLTKAKQNIESLRKILSKEQMAELILFYLLEHKLDFGTRKGYELDRNSDILPTLENFFDYLTAKCVSLETLDPDTQEMDRRNYARNKSQAHIAATKPDNFNSRNQQKVANKCPVCHAKNHRIYQCTEFNQLPVLDKRQMVRQKNLCWNCLGASHTVDNCNSRGCRVCSERHHSMLHQASPYPKSVPTTNSSSTRLNNTANPRLRSTDRTNRELDNRKVDTRRDEPSCSTQVTTLAAARDCQILLATAQIIIYTADGEPIVAKALLDSGSQSSLITKSLLHRLNHKTVNINLQISGIGQGNTKSNKMVSLDIFSKTQSHARFHVSCAVLERITCKLPQTRVNTTDLNLPNDLELADPTYFSPSTIDMLLGADIYYDLLTDGLIKIGSKNTPILQNTHLGWVIAGSIPCHKVSNPAISVALLSHTAQLDEVEKLLTQFWVIEEIPKTHTPTPEEELAENIYTSTTKVLDNGRYQVDIPLKNKRAHLQLGDSFVIAKKRFAQLEKRFQRDPQLYSAYADVIDTYIKSGYGQYVPLSLAAKDSDKKHFLPHHCVIKETALSSKIRVVFDGSAKTSSGISLNDITLKGFPVQPELFDILCRFRAAKFVFTTDIEKMYLQVSINPKQTFLQNILWRESPEQDLKCIELARVTFGTKFAPYVATRTLIDIARKAKNKYPLASKALMWYTYVDDILYSCDSLEELEETLLQLTRCLAAAGFSLHKLASNSIQLKEGENRNQRDKYDLNINDSPNKVLGISWNAQTDQFSLSIPKVSTEKINTKRAVLSQLSQMYDPLGLVNPVVVIGKQLMQNLWLHRLGWDEPLPDELQTAWNNLSESLPHLSTLAIPRYLMCEQDPIRIEIHGFADASLKAYGACLYLRAVYSNNTVSSNLITAKSRVAPIKTISLPRLELCAMNILAKLTHKITEVLHSFKFDSINLWTDSRIALCWIKSHPSRWTTFVANRVSQIQELTSTYKWRHVKSADNPADVLSRGALAYELVKSDLWFHGPTFLLNDGTNLDEISGSITLAEVPELRKVSLVNPTNELLDDFFTKFSSFSRLHRSIAWCLRFINNAQRKTTSVSGPLSTDELNKSLQLIVKILQKRHFVQELSEIKAGKPVKATTILRLNPFLDDDGIIRVGGRLSQANVSYNQRHPILLPSKDHTVSLYLRHEHIRVGHAGAQTVLSNVRLKFWPLDGLRELKRISRNCGICSRFTVKPSQQLMGDLPNERVAVSRPFQNVGIDYAGPFLIKASRLRKAPIQKSYAAIFVCMATKAVHIETVSDMTTLAFLAAFRRFIARRGNPSKVMSDNGTNFLGAKNQLKELRDLFRKTDCIKRIIEFGTTLDIEWKFIPPRSPHWGGLWEAAIKSAKHHLVRIVGNAQLTFEELATVFSQIESIMNSRPLIALTDNPNDLNYLTPGHFLIGTSLTAYPERDLSEIPENRLKFWQRCSKMQQQFWKKWSLQYLNQLQNRPKWLIPRTNLKVGDLVLLKEDNVPPLSWPRARVMDVIPGNDGRIRVAKIKTQSGEYTRSVTKLCPLPSSN